MHFHRRLTTPKTNSMRTICVSCTATLIGEPADDATIFDLLDGVRDGGGRAEMTLDSHRERLSLTLAHPQ